MRENREPGPDRLASVMRLTPEEERGRGGGGCVCLSLREGVASAGPCGLREPGAEGCRVAGSTGMG